MQTRKPLLLASITIQSGRAMSVTTAVFYFSAMTQMGTVMESQMGALAFELIPETALSRRNWMKAEMGTEIIAGRMSRLHLRLVAA